MSAAAAGHLTARLSRTGAADIVVRGRVRAALTTPCARCLAAAEVPAVAPIDLGTGHTGVSVSAGGTGLSYQWYKDGGALIGQTDAIAPRRIAITCAEVSCAANTSLRLRIVKSSSWPGSVPYAKPKRRGSSIT